MNHHDTVEKRLFELLADRSVAVCELAIGIRRVVSERSGAATELLYSGYAVSNVFTYSHRLREAFIHVATYANHVNLGFNQGTQLPDRGSRLCGNGKLIRHVRIDEIDTLEEPDIIALIDEAIQLGHEMASKGGTIQPQKFIDKSE